MPEQSEEYLITCGNNTDNSPNSALSETGKGEGFDILSDPDLRSAILNRGRQLCDLVRSRSIQKLVFLGDGGVPLVALFDAQWEQAYPGVEKPEIVILNIGREKWKPLLSYYRDETGERKADESKALQLIQNIYSISDIYGSDALDVLSEVWNENVRQEILVVDDFRASGKTQSFVERISEAINPDIRTSFFYMFTGGNQVVRLEWTDIDTTNPLLQRSDTPWEERYPLLYDSRIITIDDTEFRYSRKPDSQKKIILQTCHEMRKAVHPRYESSKEQRCIQEYMNGSS